MSKIEWTEKTWNPVTGCSKISTGCKNCYAERMSKRLAGRAGYPRDDPFKVTYHSDKLDQPVKWKKPTRIFVCSMGDLFHDDVKYEWQYKIFKKILACPQHIFMILTKRPENMRDHFLPLDELPDNLWLGITAENQENLENRMSYLANLKDLYPNITTFLSYEPALGPIDLYPKRNFNEKTLKWDRVPYFAFLDWLIVGSESGPGARKIDNSHILDLLLQCSNYKVPVFLKQAWINNKLVKMPNLGGQVWDQMPGKNE